MSKSVHLQDFRELNLVMKKEDPKRNYNEDEASYLNNIHWGQRKLILSEIQFFNLYLSDSSSKTVVYAGAAPGFHIPFLSKLYPEIEFHCYDPRKFGIKPTDKIHLHSGRQKNIDVNDNFDGGDDRYNNNEDGFFTIEKAQDFKGAFLISDIRSDSFSNIFAAKLKAENIPFFVSNKIELDESNISNSQLNNLRKRFEELNTQSQIDGNNVVDIDMRLQEDWVINMNPEKALLKFRLPYVIGDITDDYKYLAGTVFYQCWPRKESSETRLVPVKNEKGEYYQDIYSISDYEKLAYYHNFIRRNKTYYKNIFTNDNQRLDGNELVNDYDSTAEAVILRDYWISRGVKGSNIETLTLDLSRTLTKFLMDTYKNQPPLSVRRKKLRKYTPKFEVVEKGVVEAVLDKEPSVKIDKNKRPKTAPYHSTKFALESELEKPVTTPKTVFLEANSSDLFNLEYDRFIVIQNIRDKLYKVDLDNKIVHDIVNNFITDVILNNNSRNIDEFFGDFKEQQTYGSEDNDSFSECFQRFSEVLTEYQYNVGSIQDYVYQQISDYLKRRKSKKTFEAPEITITSNVNDSILKFGNKSISIRSQTLEKFKDRSSEELAIIIFRYYYINSKVLSTNIISKLSKISDRIVEIFIDPLSANTERFYTFFDDKIEKKFGSRGVFDYEFRTKYIYLNYTFQDFNLEMKKGTLIAFSESELEHGLQISKDKIYLNYQGISEKAVNDMYFKIISPDKLITLPKLENLLS